VSEYRTGSVSSADGTVIGYRQLGSGPAVLLVHGGMQAAQHLMKLADATWQTKSLRPDEVLEQIPQLKARFIA